MAREISTLAARAYQRLPTGVSPSVRLTRRSTAATISRTANSTARPKVHLYSGARLTSSAAWVSFPATGSKIRPSRVMRRLLRAMAPSATSISAERANSPAASLVASN